jgi:hypothetical protein
MFTTVRKSFQNHPLKRLSLSVIGSATIAAALGSTLWAAPSFAQSKTTTAATTTYAGIMFHKCVNSPITVGAGQTVRGIAPISGTAPQTSAYGVTARAVVFVQAGSTETTCLIKLAGGAVWGTPITIPANTTVSIPFEDTSPGLPGESYNIAIAIQAGSGGSLTVLPGSSLTIEGIASKPSNNAY